MRALCRLALARRTPYELARAWPRLRRYLPRWVQRALIGAACRDPRPAMRLLGQRLGLEPPLDSA